MIRTIKTKQFKIIAAVLAVVLVVSCVMLNTTKVHALEITGANTYSFSADGRTIQDGKLTNASIGVYITGGSQDKYNATNMKWTHDGTGWDGAEAVLFEGEGSTQKISAYYPYIENYTSGGVSLALTKEQTADSMVNDDLLYAAATDLTTAKTSINFNHLMTKLSVNITDLGTEIAGGATISKVEISGLANTATFYPENGTLTAGSDLNGSTVAYNNGTTYDALVFPASSDTITVTVTMSTDQVFTTTVNNYGGFESGKQYNITLKVGQDVVTLGGITASSWIPVDGGDLKTE